MTIELLIFRNLNENIHKNLHLIWFLWAKARFRNAIRSSITLSRAYEKSNILCSKILTQKKLINLFWHVINFFGSVFLFASFITQAKWVVEREWVNERAHVRIIFTIIIFSLALGLSWDYSIILCECACECVVDANLNKLQHPKHINIRRVTSL